MTKTAAGRRVAWADGGLNVYDHHGQAVIAGGAAQVVLAGGVRFLTSALPARVQLRPRGIAVTSGGTAGLPKLRWLVEADASGRGITLQLQVTNTTTAPLAIERLDVLAAPSGYRQWPAAELQVSVTGWQSFSPAGGRRRLDDVDAWVQPPVQSPMGPVAGFNQHDLPWLALLHYGDASALAGFVSAERYLGSVQVGAGLAGHQLVASNYAEGIELAPGAGLTSETLLLAGDEPLETLQARYGLEVQRRMKARTKRVPTGWGSWFCGFTDISQASILDNLKVAAAHRAEVPLDYFQIDDGYQTAFGDWLSINDKFPDGMRAMAQHIKAAGFKPGLWLAPFMADARSQLYRDHPDWFLTDERGRPVDANRYGDIYWPAPNYALDVSHPEVLAWLRHVIRTVCRQWGYKYLKIDFLYAAALWGRRHNPALTSVQAYRQALAVIREEAGDSFIVACGAPFLCSVGLVDGMRVNPDIASALHYTGGQVDATRPPSRDPVASVMEHHWMHGRLWSNDPDYVRVGPGLGELSEAERRSQITLIGLSGGALLVSEDLTQYQPADWQLLRRLLPAGGQPARPVGPYHNGRASRLALPITKPDEQWLVVALFNWQPTPMELTFDPAEWDLSGDYYLYDQWAGTSLGRFTGPANLGLIAPNDVRLLVASRLPLDPQYHFGLIPR